MKSEGRQRFVRVTFLGDTLVGGEAQTTLDEHGPGYAFDGISHLFARSDFVVANHEGPITCRDQLDPKLDIGRKRYWYRAEPDSAAALRDVGVRVVSLANNHVMDHGPHGLEDTTRTLDRAGIQWCGAGPTRRVARRPAVVDCQGMRFGFLSFMQRYDLYVAERLYATKSKPGPLRLSLARARADFAKLRPEVDVCVALVHWGRNYRKRNPRQVRLAAELRGAGADLVVGHHPHIPQPISILDRAPVCYSLGNGPLGTPGRFHSGRPPYGLVATFDFDPTGAVRRIAVESILVDNAQVGFRPRVAADDTARGVLRRLLPAELEWRESPGEGLVAEVPRTDPVATP